MAQFEPRPRLKEPAAVPACYGKMKMGLIAIATLLPIACSPVWSAEGPTYDINTVADCAKYWPQQPIRVEDARALCTTMLAGLGPLRSGDMDNMEKAALVFHYSHLPTSYAETGDELIQIIQLRGLADQHDRWMPTIDLTYKAWTVFGVMPVAIVSALKSSGPLAKTLSDDGFTNLIILTMHCIKQDNICPADRRRR